FGPGAQLDDTGSGYELWSPDVREDLLFDASGRLTAVEREGYSQRLDVSYPSGTRQEVTDSGGKKVVFDFKGGRVATVTDPAGGVWTFGYTNDSQTSIDRTPSARLAADPTAYHWRFAYDTDSYQLTKWLDPDCRLTTISYATGTEAGTSATWGAFAG